MENPHILTSPAGKALTFRVLKVIFLCENLETCPSNKNEIEG